MVECECVTLASEKNEGAYKAGASEAPEHVPELGKEILLPRHHAVEPLRLLGHAHFCKVYLVRRRNEVAYIYKDVGEEERVENPRASYCRGQLHAVGS